MVSFYRRRGGYWGSCCRTVGAPSAAAGCLALFAIASIALLPVQPASAAGEPWQTHTQQQEQGLTEARLAEQEVEEELEMDVDDVWAGRQGRGAHRHVENVTRVSVWEDDLALEDELEEKQMRNASVASRLARRSLRRLSSCDYTWGRWVFDWKRRNPYSGYSCPWIRSAFNCQRHGRQDDTFLKFSWRPYNCPMKQFDPNYFLELLRNKLIAVVGDSFSRNAQQALSCLLHAREPLQLWTGWINGRQVNGLIAPSYNLRIVVFVSPFLAKYSDSGNELARYNLPETGGGALRGRRYVVWLDQVDPLWGDVFQYCDLTLFMSGHWFLQSQGTVMVRNTHFVVNGQVRSMTGMQAYRAALHMVKRHVEHVVRYRGVPMWLTYSPSHYSPGRPPRCTYNRPVTRTLASQYLARDVSSRFRWQERNVFQRSRFRIVDITGISSFRPDAHVKTFYGPKRNSRTPWDCTHWCLPGLPDVWADVFQFVLRTQLRRHRK